MSEPTSTFSESWHRVAGQRVALRPSVRVRRQIFRGERWYVLDDPFNNQFYRLPPGAYEFVARLDPDRTVDAVWRECLERFPGSAPGQEEVIQILSQLYLANLLHYPLASDASALFSRQRRQRQREIRASLLNILFARFPLLDPDRFLVRTLPWIRWVFGPVGILLWLGMVGWGAKVAIDHFEALRSQAEGAIAPDNLFLLYAGMVLVKLLHEFGHGYACRHFGGEVHNMGVLLMIFTPIPYVDATAAWGFRERWKRVLVGAAGVLVEVWVAAIAAVVWASTGPGTIHALAHNIMLVASVSTLVFNLNPLLRYDGYFILSDLVGIPNLAQRGTDQLRHLVERHLFGLRRSEGPASGPAQASGLTAYALASGAYRVIVFGGLLLVIADRFLLLGLLMAAVCAVAWVLVPVGRLIDYLVRHPRLERHRLRAVTVCAATLVGALAFLALVPVPHHFRAPGIVRAHPWVEVHGDAPGSVIRVVARPGTDVAPGDALLILDNPELRQQLAVAQAHLSEVDARIRQALQEAVPNLKPLGEFRETIRRNIAQIESEIAALTVRASQAGRWIIPEPEALPGRWIPRGGDLGILVNASAHRFEATVRQEEGDRVFAHPIRHAEVRIHGQAGVPIFLDSIQVLPAERLQLPSAALGWQAKGPVATTGRDPDGRQAAEPFFEVRGNLVSEPRVTLVHGRTGEVRFDLPPEPLLHRWLRSLRQLLQRRYQV